MPPERPSLTLVGFGAFGQLIARLLAPHCRITIHDPSPAARAAAVAAGLPLVADPRHLPGDIVLLAVPVPALEPCLHAIAPHLRPGQMVIDVCSIKEEPARLMQQILPGHVEILATHPMFGPQSAAGGIAGCQVVLCPIRGQGWRRIAGFLRHMRLDVVRTTPEDHDRQAAQSQALIHILARAVAPWTSPPRIRTRSYDLFAEAMTMVRDDAPEVFEAITRGNRHADALRVQLIEALGQVTPMDHVPAPCYPKPCQTAS